MKQLLALTIILVSATFTLAQAQAANGSPQQRCTLTLAQSPTIRGFKLGMTVDEVLARFPSQSQSPTIRAALDHAPKAFGVARFSVSPNDKAFEGINTFDFEFLDNDLTSFYVAYTGPEWNSVREFISALSSSLKLPGIEYWEPSDAETYRSLKCDGFDVRAVIGGGGPSNFVKVSNLLAPQTVMARQNEAKEKARQAFRP